MKLMGMQKLTMLDYPGKLACTVFTGGCNFRCPFCHNAGLVLPEQIKTGEEIPAEEFFAFLAGRKGRLDGVAVTGGEPLLQPDLADFLGRIKEMGFSVKLDTNGSFPEKLRELCEAGLVDYVAVDIKNSPAKYPMTVGVPDFDLAPVRKTVSYLLEGHVPYEFRTTVVAGFHEPDDFVEIGKWIAGADRYYLQNFVDSGNLIEGGLQGFSEADMKALKTLVAPYVSLCDTRGI